MNYIILDLEWNQCPDGKLSEVKELPFEILEIGAVKLDSAYKELDRFSQTIRPSVYPTIHFRTREVIHLDMDSLKSSPSFSEVFENFWDWCGPQAVFCTWGNLDLFELQQNISYYHMENPLPFPLRYYNIQKLFSMVYEDGRSCRSLEYASDFLKLKKDRSFHDALSDAIYTARILQHIPANKVLKNYSIDYYRTPRSRREEIYEFFDQYSKFISREFFSRQDAMRDRKVTAVSCPLCRKAVRRKIRWFHSGNHNYLCLSYCEEHGWIKGKIRIRKTQRDTYFCIKTIKQVSIEDADQIRARKRKLISKHEKAPV